MKEWITGRNPVYEVLRAKRRDVFRLWVADGAQEKGRLEEILKLAMARKATIERVNRAKLDNLGDSPQGVALEVSAYPYAQLEDILARASELGEAPFILILDTLQNPQNLGTLLRTAEAVGMHGVLLPLRQTVDVTPAVVNASSGASEHMLVAQANLAQSMRTLKEEGVWIGGLDGTDAGQPPDQVRLDGPLALVVGNEGDGMRQLVRQSCDFLMRLPMQGQVESLNAAVAGSVAVYLAYMARLKKAEGK
jgi:23S rRNA (guanosine2251-2'-O)-methyltransferase